MQWSSCISSSRLSHGTSLVGVAWRWPTDDVFRTRQTVEWPDALRASTMWLPIKPVAPVTSIFITDSKTISPRRCRVPTALRWPHGVAVGYYIAPRRSGAETQKPRQWGHTRCCKAAVCRALLTHESNPCCTLGVMPCPQRNMPWGTAVFPRRCRGLSYSTPQERGFRIMAMVRCYAVSFPRTGESRKYPMRLADPIRHNTVILPWPAIVLPPPI